MEFLLVVLLVIALVANTFAYDKSAAASWAQGCAYGCTECPDSSACECTMFTTHALTHGGWGGGEFAGCSTLWSNFKNGKYAGWTRAGNTADVIHKGDAVIMNNGHEGDASHCCVGTGPGVVSCHNPGKKDVAPSTTWYSGGYINAVYTYSGAAALNGTMTK